MPTAKQDLVRQLDALRAEGVPPKHIYVDKKFDSTTNRPGLREALDQARDGDVIVVHTFWSSFIFPLGELAEDWRTHACHGNNH